MIQDAVELAHVIAEGIRLRTAGEANASTIVIGATVPETVRFDVETVEGARFLVSIYRSAVPVFRANAEPPREHVANALQILRGLHDRSPSDPNFWIILGAAERRLILATGGTGECSTCKGTVLQPSIGGARRGTCSCPEYP